MTKSFVPIIYIPLSSTCPIYISIIVYKKCKECKTIKVFFDFLSPFLETFSWNYPYGNWTAWTTINILFKKSNSTINRRFLHMMHVKYIFVFVGCYHTINESSIIFFSILFLYYIRKEIYLFNVFGFTCPSKRYVIDYSALSPLTLGSFFNNKLSFSILSNPIHFILFIVIIIGTIIRWFCHDK